MTFLFLQPSYKETWRSAPASDLLRAKGAGQGGRCTFRNLFEGADLNLHSG